MDRPLELIPLLDRLIAQRLVPADCRQRFKHETPGEHPLESIANQHLEDLRHPGRRLDLDSLCQWLAQQAGQAFLRLDPLGIDLPGMTGLMSAAFARRHGILAVAHSADSVTVASAEPWVCSWEADLTRALKRRVVRVVASPLRIRQISQDFFRLARSVSDASQLEATAPASGNLEQLLELGDDQPDADDAHIVSIVDWLLQYAFEQRASDIHLEPRREQGRLRLRIDGVLHDAYPFPPAVTLAITSRLKNLGRMNVAEKRRPQDGRIKTRSPAGDEVELRLSTLPTTFGEKLVMRIFDPQLLRQGSQALGFDGAELERWQRLLRRPNGIILVTGPTGSGKTSTLYSALKQLATSEVNVCTLEDPIEMVEPAFNQTQVQPGIGLDFASGVRALLRQDPDIIMVGEIRDLETAQVAIQAALTGHLVLSTLHTNDACSAIGRLLELGVAYYLIKATLVGVLAQRLVRTLCVACKTSAGAVGCRECRQTGYHGRTGVYEVLELNERLAGLIGPECDVLELRKLARSEGMDGLRENGLRKIAAGVTTQEEINLISCSAADGLIAGKPAPTGPEVHPVLVGAGLPAMRP
ncbi:GspE/PulE family protein [Pseudomonas putida]|uniref:Type II secretion system protein E n=1 Tax=Pseudomonas putida TaxID=303 RepID=A0A1Q9R765_PSEPU|nr:GspE/PulE family protein [Pseudomonas putida]OLS63208.1 Type II secretion system protein E [Pseudomonas putida]